MYNNNDKENDILFMLDEQPYIELNTKVVFMNGSIGEISATDLYGFIVKGEDLVSLGDSGTAVIREDNSEQIGYVSSILPNGSVRCIWI